MNIDLTKLITNLEEEIELNLKVDFKEDFLSQTTIKKLKNVIFNGEISKIYDDFEIVGNLKGTMVLPDDVTLEDVDYKFSIDIDENFSGLTKENDNNLIIIKNRLDISNFLWQNILAEIPLKVVSKKNEDLILEGNGWRLITEEELKRRNNSPFSELKDKISSGRSD
jgi:uncharacterized metal-binding protein YceD (DUF177 family)